MKQTQGDKHMVAWFKIAEYVSRGEKERALGVYRLLSHSFNDKAVANQLEGDINCAFGEYELATSLYMNAMETYSRSERFLEAVAVCEHLISINAEDTRLYREAIKLYAELGNMHKAYEYIEKLLNAIFTIKKEHQVQEFLAFLHGISDELYDHAVRYIDNR